MKTIYKRTNKETGEEEFFTFSQAKQQFGLRISHAAFDAKLDTFEQDAGYSWETSYEPLPITGLNCGEQVTIDDKPWWTDWITDDAVTTSIDAEKGATTELRQEIYERNYGIRVGIARDNWEHQNELFARPTTEVPIWEPAGIRVDDGTNILDMDLWSLIDRMHITLNWCAIRYIIAGKYDTYSFQLSSVALRALSDYEGYFEELWQPPQVEYVAGKTIPIEQYNRFGEIQYVYPNLKTAAKANNLTMQKLLLKLNSWDDNSRVQFRYARDEDRPNTTKVFFPLEQYKDGVLINRFTTLQEASAALGYSKSVIGRWTQTNDLDNFGCSWKRISQ